MSRVLCNIGSTMPSGRFAVPVAVWMEAAAWDALAIWSGEVPCSSECPVLARLLAAPLPAALATDDLPALARDVTRATPLACLGPAADGLAALTEFVDKALMF